MVKKEEKLKPNLGKALLGIWGLCVFATSAFLLPDFTRAASGDGFAGVAILIPAIQDEEAEEAPEAETPAEEPAAEEPAAEEPAEEEESDEDPPGCTVPKSLAKVPGAEGIRRR